MKSRLNNIQALRFFAALMVVFAHVDLPRYSSAGISSDLFAAGAFGVDIFFVISGFIMMHVSAGRRGPVDAFHFLLRRILRVWPLYAAFTLFAVWLAYEGNWHNWLMGYYPPEKKSLWWIAESLTFTHWDRSPVYAIGWTLIYEFWFYCSVALCIFLRARTVVFFPICAALMLVANMAGIKGPVDVWANPLMLEFLFGVILFHLFRGGKLPGSKVALAVGFVGSATMLLTYEQADVGLVGRALWLGAAAFLLVGSTLMLERRVQPPKVLVFLGDASYSLYLAHWLVMTTLPSLLDLYDMAGMGPIEYILLHVAVSLVLAVAVYFLIETPLRWIVTGRWKARQQPQALPLDAAASVTPQ